MNKIVVIKGSLLWDGISATAIADGAVLVEQGLVKAVGTAREIMSAPHDKVIDFPNATLLPGLIDCHNHLSMDPTLNNYLDRMADVVAEQALRATAMMRKDLFAGVTTSRCCGDKEFLDIECRKAVQNGLVEGPRLLVATRGIRALHGHGFVGYPFEGVKEIRQAIKENIAGGADFIKIYITGTLKGGGPIVSYLSKEEIKAAIEEAHQAGKRTSAHCVGGEGLDWCLEAGLDSLEHAYHISDAQIERLSDSHTWPVLTPSPLLNDERVNNLPKKLISGHFEERKEISNRMAAIIASGIPFALGTDGMHAGMAQEAAYLVELGATAHTALTAATINGAKVCGIENETGSLQVGKFADIVVVNGNPLQNIDHLNKVEAVIKQGRIVFSSI